MGLKDDMTAPRTAARPVAETDWLHTGSTLLNLALSGRPDGGFAKRKYFWIVGDSSSGKTFLTLTCLAEASINPEFDGYDFIFDNAEDGALMNMRKYFGRRMAERLQPPDEDDGVPVYSEIIEDFYFHLDDRFTAVEKGKGNPFIYVLDSMDALSSNYEGKKFQEKKRERRGGAKAKGDYGDGKAKMNSTYIRSIVGRLRKTGSILIVLSQTRDNIDAGMFEEQQTHAGGRALKFYATAQLWSSVGKRLKKEVKEQKRQVGIVCRVAVKKNRLTGKEWTVEFPIYHSAGIDDVGGCIDFLVKEKHWPRNSSGTIDGTKDIDECKGRREALVRWIEENDMEDDLQEIVADVWRNIEAATRVERKSKYD